MTHATIFPAGVRPWLLDLVVWCGFVAAFQTIRLEFTTLDAVGILIASLVVAGFVALGTIYRPGFYLVVILGSGLPICLGSFGDYCLGYPLILGWAAGTCVGFIRRSLA